MNFLCSLLGLLLPMPWSIYALLKELKDVLVALMFSAQSFFLKLLFPGSVNFAKSQQSSSHLLCKDYFSQSNQLFLSPNRISGIQHISLKTAHQQLPKPWRSKTKECRQAVLFCPSVLLYLWPLQHVAVVKMWLLEACFHSSFPGPSGQRNLGVFSCARTVRTPCSPCLTPGYALLLFSPQLWCSLAPSWAPSASQNQSTVSWRFCELNWLPREPGEPGKVQEGVAGWEWEGDRRVKDSASPGAAASWQGNLADGSPGLIPQEKHTFLTEVIETIDLAVALENTLAPLFSLTLI